MLTLPSACRLAREVTSRAQIKERYPSTTPQQLMFFMNAWCTLYYAAYMFALTGARHLGGSGRWRTCTAN